MPELGAYSKKIPKPKYTKEEAALILAENTVKILKLDSMYGKMKQSDYDEISRRLFDEKNYCLSILNKC